eukprot:1149901-Pelagomonas_calceolata.AAC.2
MQLPSCACLFTYKYQAAYAATLWNQYSQYAVLSLSEHRADSRQQHCVLRQINNPDFDEAVLHRLKAYACRRFHAVNTQKLEVVCFNPRTDSIPPLVHNNDALPY